MNAQERRLSILIGSNGYQQKCESLERRAKAVGGTDMPHPGQFHINM